MRVQYFGSMSVIAGTFSPFTIPFFASFLQENLQESAGVDCETISSHSIHFVRFCLFFFLDLQ